MKGSETSAVSGIIDAHQHFWQYNATQHSWINDDMAIIRKDFMPADLQPLLEANQVAGCVAVQADQSADETDFLLNLAANNSFIKGIVGWVDLRADNLQQQLEHYTQFRKLKGFRHILQGEEPAFMLQPAFVKGIGLLKRFNYTYDILIYPQHLSAAIELVKQLPEQAFVIDHLAKPYISKGILGEWKTQINTIAQYPNVYCKVSGMVTEADMRHWKPSDFTPYLDEVSQAFGTDRLMFGSDWPVCLAAASYHDTLQIVKDYFSTFSMAEQGKLFTANAITFYHLI
ncbi:MAG TPA: amidohydrolase family protein [Chitinophagaceae bacterium]|nr:amidohydrolase family protein [Chitinophagaceae bacterium]